VATMAKEMMEFTKNNIISQAATAMLEGLAA
jgi:flagellin-like hook-associated protein FlgL